MKQVQDAINNERRYQDEKHGTIDEHHHTVGEWLLILEKKISDAKAQWYYHGDKRAMAEVLKIAATSIACIEQRGVVLRSDK